MRGDIGECRCRRRVSAARARGREVTGEWGGHKSPYPWYPRAAAVRLMNQVQEDFLCRNLVYH